MKKNIGILVDIALAIAIIILFALVLRSPKSAQKAPVAVVPAAEGEGVSVALPIAYVNIDSLEQYEFYKVQNDALQRKQENIRLDFAQKEKNLQKDQEDFQKKLENGVYATEKRAQDEYTRIMKTAENLQAQEQKKIEEMATEVQRLNGQLRDSISNAIAIYNADGRYQLILKGASEDAWVSPSVDITADILNLLNSRYTGK